VSPVSLQVHKTKRSDVMKAPMRKHSNQGSAITKTEDEVRTNATKQSRAAEDETST